MKFSRQRELIYNYVKSYPVHPTAEQVHSALKKDNPGLSLGTVYRNLNQLSSTGMLAKIYIAGENDRFDGRTDEHSHMICEKCSRVFDIELNVSEKLAGDVEAKHGHKLTLITLAMRGVCRECFELTSENLDNSAKTQ